jgi:hypothetical protein
LLTRGLLTPRLQVAYPFGRLLSLDATDCQA